MTTLPIKLSDLSALVTHDADPAGIVVQLRDARRETLAVFEQLDDVQQTDLAVQAWRLGLHAMQNAYRQAEEARLSDIGRTLREDLERQFERLMARQTETVERVLGEYFDPESGAIRERLDAFTRDDGELMEKLRAAIGPEGSLLAPTLAGLVGAESPLLKKLDPTRKDGIVHELSQAIDKALTDQRSATARMLDPLAQEGPVATLFRALRQELARAESDRGKQLAVATSSLDPKNPDSLLCQLVNQSQKAREELLCAINPNEPKSPLAAIKSSLTTMLGEHIKTEKERAEASDKRLRTFEDEVKATLTRLETKKTHDARSAVGGRTFEDTVVEFVRRTFGGAPMTVEAVGNSTGTINRCRIGDVVARFTEESQFAGSGLVVEAKHDQSYTESAAVAELVQAAKNRNAQAGVFVMAQSHAQVGFPSFARHGTSVLVVWDPEDTQTDAYLQAALLLAQCMAARNVQAHDEGKVEAINDIENRITTEIARLAKMKKHVESILRNGEELSDDVRKGGKALALLLRNAKEVLATLQNTQDDFSASEPVRAGVFELEAAEE
jgi:hypothetical protein